MNHAGHTIADGNDRDGEPQAQMIPAETALPSRQLSRAEKDQRIAELAALREKYHTGKTGLTVDQILEEDRADRL